MTIISIDPGQSGGIVVCNGEDVAAYPMPETQGDILELIREAEDESEWGSTTICVLEQVGGFTAGNPAPGSAMFKFGESYGFIKGVVQALNIRLILVRPQKWTKHFSLGTKSGCATKTEWKNKLKAEAQRRFPAIKVTLQTADALLILDWFRETSEKRE